MRELESFGYSIPRSQANFLWCTQGPHAAGVYEKLKAQGILVRLMRYPGYPDGLRISVGTEDEVDRLLGALKDIVG